MQLLHINSISTYAPWCLISVLKRFRVDNKKLLYTCGKAMEVRGGRRILEAEATAISTPRDWKSEEDNEILSHYGARRCRPNVRKGSNLNIGIGYPEERKLKSKRESKYPCVNDYPKTMMTKKI